jgi:hypothetical protein
VEDGTREGGLLRRSLMLSLRDGTRERQIGFGDENLEGEFRAGFGKGSKSLGGSRNFPRADVWSILVSLLDRTSVSGETAPSFRRVEGDGWKSARPVEKDHRLVQHQAPRPFEALRHLLLGKPSAVDLVLSQSHELAVAFLLDEGKETTIERDHVVLELLRCRRRQRGRLKGRRREDRGQSELSDAFEEAGPGLTD